MKRLNEKQEAIRDGKKYYFTGRPCKYGHLSERYTKNGMCVQCVSIHGKKWRANHKERVRELNKRHAPKRRELVRLWRLKNLEECREYDRNRYPLIAEKKRKERVERYWRNPDKERVYNRQWRMNNREAAIASTKRWIKNNPEKMALLNKVNSAMRRSAEGKHTTSDLKDIFRMQNGKCAYCKIKLHEKYHVDHIIPIVRGGTNHRKNLQILCVKCNKSKHARDPLEFAQSMGFML